MVISVHSCDNLFSPKLDTSTSSEIITDQKTIDGLFQNFKYSYTFKDTSVYSALLTDDFVFTYRDYVLGYDVSWDKQTELRTTNGLFQNAQKLEVVWNNIITQFGDSVDVSLRRSFNLAITFNPSDIIRLNGFADMTFTRNTPDDKWKIRKWRDESF
ncbi:MAG: hypothetical protein JW917_07830 [Ignavibacteria bacterium]|nr:hypothetical protein [Ignavibacteria bacterium]